MSTLNENQIEKLLPILEDIIAVLKKRDKITEKQIKLFLKNLELPEEVFFKEAEKWADLLLDYKNSDDEDEKDAIEIICLKRGIPKASLTISFSELKNNIFVEESSDLRISIHPKNLNFSVKTLNFGKLATGEKKSITFFVKGGPGEIENTIEYLKLSKTTFGSEKEEIAAEIFGGSLGEQIFHEILFRTVNEVKELNVIAEWKDKQREEYKQSETIIPFNEKENAKLEEKKKVIIDEKPIIPAQNDVLDFVFDNVINKTAFVIEKTGKILNYFRPKIPKPKDEMVLVKGGTFMMGSYDYDNEKPIHKVTLAYDFYIGKYPVTQKEYQNLLGNNPSCFNGENLPVEQVTWFDAIGYCNEKSRNEGFPIAYSELLGELLDSSGKFTTDITKVKGYRLPTEAEWEFAARGGIKSLGYKFAGNNNPDEVAWYYDNSFTHPNFPIGNQTHAVGSKRPNELGIFDMSGNVWEWCQDWYDKNYYKKSPATNPFNNLKSLSHVLRGGTWRHSSGLIRVVSRYSLEMPDNSFGTFGFRIVRTA